MHLEQEEERLGGGGKDLNSQRYIANFCHKSSSRGSKSLEMQSSSTSPSSTLFLIVFLPTENPSALSPATFEDPLVPIIRTPSDSPSSTNRRD